MRLGTVPAEGGRSSEPSMIKISDDPVVGVNWSADGAWLACCLATDGGVRTQVWVVRPDGSDARRIAGSSAEHAELGPWTRSGHRVVVTIPAERADDQTVSYLADPASGELTTLASGDLIGVLDLSVDQDYVIIRDGQRGRQFCVVLDRRADQDYPLLPHPASGSTERAIIRPSPAGEDETLVAYVATDAGLPRRQLVAIPLGPHGWRGDSGVLSPREDAELGGPGRGRRWPAAAAGLERRWSQRARIRRHVDRRAPCRTGRSGPGGLWGSAEP